MSDKHICQIAFTSINAAQLRDWYAHCFGLVKCGKIFGFPPMPTDHIQGVKPNPAESAQWLIDQQDYFQLEFFNYYRPRPRLRPADWRPCDIGYNLAGFYVTDFDKVLSRIAGASDWPVPQSIGERGDRRVCLQDPEGNWIEIMERDPITRVEGADPCVVRPELLTATRFIRLSVPDMEASVERFVNVMGLSRVDDLQLHTPEHEAMWGLPGASTRATLLRGINFLVEVVQYLDPEPKPWPPGYQISDQGYMNFAIGYRSSREFDRHFEHVKRGGFRPNNPSPVDIGIFRVMYVNDPDGFSVEMLNARKALWSLTGFNPGEPYVQNEVLINATPQEAWHRLIDHAGMGKWSLFKTRVLRAGRDAPNGPGCIRKLSAFGLNITEEVVAWEEGSRYTYKLRHGAPFRWHQGDVFVSRENGLTKVRWAIRFESWIPFTGRITAWLLQKIFGRALRKLKAQLEN
jgi:catechol 2,3-dioxygenase-like lactoylglutathione lyase family enzyme